MAERVGDFEWRGEGEEAEIAVYAPDPETADLALQNALPAARLPGVVNPVHAAASGQASGLVSASATHAAPELFSAPEWGMLLVSDAPVESLGVPFEQAPRLIRRRLSEVALPTLGERGLRDLSEAGAAWAAGEGFIEEEDLTRFGNGRGGDPESLGRRALSAGTRDWARPGGISVCRVIDVLDADLAEETGLEPGALVLAVGAGAEDLGRLALSGHRNRVAKAVVAKDFGATPELPAAPSETEEAKDLLSASQAAANYAAGRSALILWALRRAFGNIGTLSLRAAWRIGGLEDDAGLFVHRDGLAESEEGKVLVCGRSVVSAAGEMAGSLPPFGAPEVDGAWPWEEVGLCERVVVLEAAGRSSGEG